MHIEVARVPPEGLSLSGEDETVFPDPSAEHGFKPTSGVSYDVHANYVSGELIVTGNLSVEIEFPCSRCAVPYIKEIEDRRFAFGCEAPDGTESVDLTGEMREAILCAFPSHPLCRKECKGLCAHCGRDLNEGGCECVPDDEDDRWDALGGLKL